MSGTFRRSALTGCAGVAVGIVLIALLPSFLVQPSTVERAADTSSGSSKEPQSIFGLRNGVTAQNAVPVQLAIIVLISVLVAISAYAGIRKILYRDTAVPLS